MSKKKRKRKAKLTLIIVLLLACVILYFILFKLTSKKDDDIIVIDTIKDYGYTLNDRDTSLKKEIFVKLKDLLKDDNVDYEKYAEYLSELFVIDFYTLDNKLNKYDVGATEYVLESGKEKFVLKAQDTIYKYMVDKKSRKDKLAIVKSTEVSNVEKSSYEYSSKKYDAYKLSISWDYEKDLGYDKKASVVLMKDNNKLYVVEFNTGE